MPVRFIAVALIIGALAGELFAADLYKVDVASRADARILASIPVDAVAKVDGGYLVLADVDAAAAIEKSGLRYTSLAIGISRDELAVDMRRDDSNLIKYPVIYEEGGLRILRANYAELSQSREQLGLAPIRTPNLRIEYTSPTIFRRESLRTGVDLDSLINLVSQDSVVSYLERLQGFYRRVSGTDSNYASADWVYSKFQKFGYDSVEYDEFTENIYGEEKVCENVIAYKIGSLYPGRCIIVGGHRDAVPNSPGADDNGSGTVSAMEIARVLANIDTKVTFIFIAFDAEEQGLLGSYHYANEAYERGDTILCMFNADMIGYIGNADTAAVGHGDNATYADLWSELADSLLDLTTVLFSAGGSSDHYPFMQLGWTITYADEWQFSSVYHSPHDSTTYISFDYMTKLIKASLATCYAAMLNETMPEIEFAYPGGVPRFVSPDEESTFRVLIEATNGGVIVPGTELLHYSLNGAPYETISLQVLQDGRYEAVIPAMLCQDDFSYYLTAELQGGDICYSTNPETPQRLTIATSYAIYLDDDFNTYSGWIVDGDAADGRWERVIPAPVGEAGAPRTDYDGSGYCYLTDNAAYGGDVDGGSTRLTSPSMDVTPDGAVVSYARWFYTYQGETDPRQDSLTVYISSDSGANWTLVETVGPEEQSSGGWYTHEFRTTDVVAPSAETRLRFIASDIGDVSTVEAAVDAAFVYSSECSYEPFICGDADGSSAVDVDDVVFLIAYIFSGGPAPVPTEAGDTDCSNSIDIDDVVYLITYIFAGGPDPCANCP
jgi:hypothetical protein